MHEHHKGEREREYKEEKSERSSTQRVLLQCGQPANPDLAPEDDAVKEQKIEGENVKQK